jgi:hypothetical protein
LWDYRQRSLPGMGLRIGVGKIRAVVATATGS